jgi:hypothetical protein
MTKNFKSLYDGGNDSSGLEQKIFIKQEALGARGTMVIPTNPDYILQLAGGAGTFNRPFEASPVRSGRHNVTGIEKKDVTEWNYPFYFMIDTSLGGASDAEIDPAARVLFHSALGKEYSIANGDANLAYDSSTAPFITFTLFENGDIWAKQMPGAFVNNMVMNFPGDGEATYEPSGQAKTLYYVGIARSIVDNNGGNTITVDAGDESAIPVGAVVMIIEADGTTRSADTPDGSPRIVTDVTGSVITVDGAVLADADGSGGEIFLCYYEPEAPVAINDPITGLVGSITIAGLTNQCIRNSIINIENNHEMINYCFGERGLSGPLFAPTSRVNINVTNEINLNAEVLKLLNTARDFSGIAVDLILGDILSRYMEINMPKWTPSIPVIDVPDEGTIPVSFEGMAYATTETSADEILISFK